MLITSILLAVPFALVIHELGHLVTARSCNVPASELGLGLGPKLFGFQLGSIRFSLRALPLGSFVRLDGAALRERAIEQQLFVHLGGILFNLIAGLATYDTVTKLTLSSKTNAGATLTSTSGNLFLAAVCQREITSS